MDEDGGLAVVRPTRWKTRDDHLVKENADPSEATGGKLSLGSRDDDDADHDDVNMDDVSREYDERVVREDDAAFDQLLDLAEGAMHSVRLKASPAKTEPRETEDDDDDDEGSEVDEYDEYDVADDRAAEMEHDASEANSARENSDVSASSSFDFDVDEPDADDRGGATTTAAEPTAEPTASPARAARAPTRRETRPARVSGATRLSASRADPSLATAKAWLSEFAALGAKQRAAETALAGTLGDDADEYAAERQTLRDDLFARLERVRGGVRALAGHVEDVRGGEAYVLELGRLMDGAERDVVALKEAQKAAYDRLAREERDLTRHCDDFAQRVETWDADTSDPVWAGVLRDASGKRQHAGRGRRVYGAPTPKKAEPWSRGASASKKRAVADERPASARLAHSALEARSVKASASAASSAGRHAKPPGGPGPWARAASARSPGETRGGSPGSASGKSSSAQKAAAAAARREPPPPPWRSTTPSSRSTGPRAAGRMSTTRGGAGAWRAATCTTRRRRRWRRTT